MSANRVSILERLPVACIRLNQAGHVVWCNDRWRAVFGSRDDGTQAGLAAWFPEEEAVNARLTAAAASSAAGTAAEPVRLRGRRHDAVPITVALDVVADDETGGMVCVGREIAGADLLSESQRYLDVAFAVAPIGMAMFDTQGRYVRVNTSLCRLLGRSSDELIGRRDQEFTHPDDRPGDVEAAWRILNGELDTWQTEKRFINPSGEVVWAIANMVFLRDDEGRPLCWLGQFQDITARRRREEQLGHQAVHDELTNVANRRGLMQELEQRTAHARRYDEPGALLVLDLDGFKAVNDRDGHPAGDRVLVQAAAALQTRLRTTDFVARMGGDEFAVILPHADAGSARAVAEDLLCAFRDLRPHPLSASCGISLYDNSVGDAASLLASADAAMYAAKAAGRDRVSITQAPSAA